MNKGGVLKERRKTELLKLKERKKIRIWFSDCRL